MTDLPPVRRAARASSAALAAALSFVIPGLGQLYAGRQALGLAFAAPMLVLVGMIGVGLVFGLEAVLRALLVPGALTALVVVILALMVWRMAAIGHAGLTTPTREPRPLVVGLVVVLVLLTGVMHGWAAATAMSAEQALARIFSPPAESGGFVPPDYGHLDPVDPSYRWDGTERINVLLIGYDSGPGRTDELTDTILVATVDPVSATAALVSIPRDTGFVPLPDRHVYADGIYPRRINELSQQANADPARWCPGLDAGTDCGIAILRQAVGLYLGLDIQYTAWVDLLGFAALVDAIGGIELCLPGVLADPDYNGPTWVGRGIVLEAGCRHYDGAHALAFARIRKGTMTLPDGTVEGQDDFLRAARQQEFLLALQRRLAEANLVLALPGLLTAVSETVTTDFPRTQAGDLASLASRIDAANIERVVLGWPGHVDLPVDPLRYYLLIPRRQAVRATMAALIGDAELIGWYLGSSAAGPPN
jgi:LCP family protein required for cell wall assembly